MARINPWIKLHRKMVNWGWYTDNNVKSVFIHILFMANDDDSMWMGHHIPRGSFATSIQQLSKTLGISVKSVRTALSKLKSTNEVAIESNTQFTLIQLNNWDTYQSKGEQNGKPEANEGQTKGNSIKKVRSKKLEVPKGTGDESQSKGDPFINNLIQEFDTVLELGGLWSDAVSSRRRYAHLIKTSRKWTPEQCAMLLRSAKIHPRHCNWSKMSDLYYRGVELIQEAKTKANKPFMAEIK